MGRNILAMMLVAAAALPAWGCREKSRMSEAKEIVAKMPLERKIGQMMMVGVSGKSMSTETASTMGRYYPGGIILFGFNLGDRNAISSFTHDLQNESMKHAGMPLFISIDQEGGRVWRIVDGVTQFPGNMAMGACGDPELVRKAALVLGMQLRALGVNMNLAPVLDVNNNPLNPVINTRSFGSSPLSVAMLGVAYILGIQQAYCIAVAKHFPGHGDTGDDSHVTLPVIRYGLERLMSVEFTPFREAFAKGVEAVMTAHIAYPEIRKSMEPATLSKFFLDEVLRKTLGFRGIVITDDMEMHAISKNFGMGEAAVKTVEAGADIVLISSNGKSIGVIHSALMNAVASKRIDPARIDLSVEKIVELKLRYRIADYREGKVTTAEPAYAGSQLEVLRDADDINRRITAKSVSAHSWTSETVNLLKSPSTRLLLVTDNAYFSGRAGARFNERLTASGEAGYSAALRSLAANREQGRGVALVYHVNIPYVSRVRRAMDISGRLGVPIVVVSTGNPFPLSAIRDLPPVLYSFSNTQESYNQIVSCLAGDFTPGGLGAFNMGYPTATQ